MRKITVGDLVNKIEFTDCFGKLDICRKGLTVTSILEIDGSPAAGTNRPLPAYTRITAVGPGITIDAAERFFELAGGVHMTREQLESAIDEISREMRGPMPDAERMLLYYDRKELRQKLEHLKGEEVSR